jgi:hypothetical protein
MNWERLMDRSLDVILSLGILVLLYIVGWALMN